jgi:long-chain fatty acid transport protein
MKAISMKLIPALVATAFAGTASAAGFGLMEQNGSGLGNAFAGSAAVAENASTIYYNPAGMTQLKGKNFSAGVDYISLSAKFSDKGSTGLMTGAQNQEGGDSAFVPNGYFSYQLNDQWFVGIGLSVPYGMRTVYPSSWKGSYTAMDTDIQSVNLNPSVAWKMNDVVSLGFGVDYQLFKATYTTNVNLSPFGNLGNVLKIQGSTTSWGWNTGALFNLSDATKVGVSYRSKIKHNIDHGNWSTSNASGGASLSIELPDTWIVSATHKLNDQWELLADISQQGWSSVPKLVINVPGFVGGTPQSKAYNWKDTTRIALGANYQYSERVKLRVGLASDEGVVDDAYRTARLPDANRIWYSFGVQYKPTKDSAIDVAYAYVKADKAAVSDKLSNAALGTLNGEYDSNVQVLGVQYSMNF